MTGPDPDLAHELSAYRDWWRLAGVDCDFADDATAWLTPSVPNAPAAAPATSPAPPATSPAPPADAPAGTGLAKNALPPDLLGDSPPDSLDAFREWWLTAPGLDTIGPRGRIPPRGSAKAALMVIVVHPEESDREQLLSGPQGRLLDAILAAMGLAPEETYFASALPRFMPMADCAAEARRGMTEVLSRHIDLASPRRIVAFGAGLAVLLGHDAEKDYGNLPIFNHKPSSIPVLVSEDLDSLMGMSKLKARFWRRWIEWSSEQA